MLNGINLFIMNLTLFLECLWSRRHIYLIFQLFQFTRVVCLFQDFMIILTGKRHSNNVLDSCSTFYLNNWQSNYAYQTLWQLYHNLYCVYSCSDSCYFMLPRNMYIIRDVCESLRNTWELPGAPKCSWVLTIFLDCSRELQAKRVFPDAHNVWSIQPIKQTRTVALTRTHTKELHPFTDSIVPIAKAIRCTKGTTINSDDTHHKITTLLCYTGA